MLWLWFILKWILICLLSIVGSFFIRDLYSYLIWLKYYKPQGIKYIHIPFIGVEYFFTDKILKYFDKNWELVQKFKISFIKGFDNLAKLRQFNLQRGTEDIIAVNYRQNYV